MLEFVCNQGLNALVSVGNDSDQTYQQYILKALGELAVYVDGMHGLIQCNEIIQWLYQLTNSKVSRVGGAGTRWEGPLVQWLMNESELLCCTCSNVANFITLSFFFFYIELSTAIHSWDCCSHMFFFVVMC